MSVISHALRIFFLVFCMLGILICLYLLQGNTDSLSVDSLLITCVEDFAIALVAYTQSSGQMPNVNETWIKPIADFTKGRKRLTIICIIIMSFCSFTIGLANPNRVICFVSSAPFLAVVSECLHVFIIGKADPPSC